MTELLQNVPYVVLLGFCLLIANRGADAVGENFAKGLVYFLGGMASAVLTIFLMLSR